MNKPSVLLFGAALLLIGMGYIAVTPPFEGFDESAHYSSIRQIADDGTLPVYGKSTISRNVIVYAGPKPYETADPPFDSGNTYAKFFSNPSSIAAFTEQQKLPRRAYEASDQLNWQTQHPPLYYGLMSIVARSTAGLSLLDEIFLLRSLSYALATGGVMLAIAAAQVRMSADKASIGFVIYPILLPMFFPEFARIGNDSLCLLFAGACALFTALADRERERRLWPLLLGVSLGFGLLTKALFLPIALGYALFFGIGFALEPAERRRHLELLMLTLIPATAIGGGWYLYKLLAYGSISGSQEAVLLEEQGGLLAGLQHRFSAFLLASSAMVTLASYVGRHLVACPYAPTGTSAVGRRGSHALRAVSGLAQRPAMVAGMADPDRARLFRWRPNLAHSREHRPVGQEPHSRLVCSCPDALGCARDRRWLQPVDGSPGHADRSRRCPGVCGTFSSVGDVGSNRPICRLRDESK